MIVIRRGNIVYNHMGFTLIYRSLPYPCYSSRFFFVFFVWSLRSQKSFINVLEWFYAIFLKSSALPYMLRAKELVIFSFVRTLTNYVRDKLAKNWEGWVQRGRHVSYWCNYLWPITIRSLYNTAITNFQQNDEVYGKIVFCMFIF